MRNLHFKSILLDTLLPWYFSLLEHWYRLAAPPLPGESASLVQKELARRGRIASISLLLITVIMLTLLPTGFLRPGHVLFYGLLVGLLLSSAAIFWNRRGKLVLSCLLIVAAIDGGQCFSILSSPGGLSLSTVQLLDHFILPELVVIAFFPVESVFIVAILNSLLTWLLVQYAPHTAEIGRLMHIRPVAEGPIILQGAVAVILYLWVRFAYSAIIRATRTDIEMRTKRSVAEYLQKVVDQQKVIEVTLLQQQEALHKIAQALSQVVQHGEHMQLPSTGTSLDVLLPDINVLLAERCPHQHSSQKQQRRLPARRYELETF